jgi:sec-independent protein translocase protein TatA
MLGNLTGFHLIIILAIILLLFGAPKLPGLAKSIAQSMRIFKNEIGDDKKTADDDVRHSTVDHQHRHERGRRCSPSAVP